MATEEKSSWEQHVQRVSTQLREIYTSRIKPLEDKFKYDLFRPSWFEETIVNQKPFISFFGPWSAGKSTFINHLLGSNHLWTGPQPTTAEFTCVCYGEETGPLDGRILANAKDMPFRGLNEFGESFLQNFSGYQVNHELLKSVTLIDTPGVLESAKEIHQRKYDYIRLARWFAERSDLIFVMFDPTKLDAGVELRLMFRQSFKGMESKVRIVLNKADSVNTQELMRVYGSLFWNLSNMISSTEPPRLYCGSFWDQPYQEGTFHLLFSEEKADLIHELTETIPAQHLDKKVASLIRRAKDVFIHAIIIGGMRQDLPMLFGKDKAKRKALDELHITYERVGAKYKMNWRDFPPVDEYRNFLEKFDLETFPTLEKVDKEGHLAGILRTIEDTLPKMLRPVKAGPIADPRNKEARKELQHSYNQVITNQVLGKQGIQGSSDVVQTGTRDVNFHNISPQQPSTTQGGFVDNAFATPPAQSAQASPAPAPAPAANPMQAQQMQMLQTMMANPANMQNPQMMQMMMQMMQSMQTAQQTPPQTQASANPPAPTPAPVQQPPPPLPEKEAAPLPPQPQHVDPTPPTPASTTPVPAASPQMTPEQMQMMMQMMQQQQQQQLAQATTNSDVEPIERPE